MGDDTADFDFFEKQFTELVADFQLLTVSEQRLKEALRTEATRAEAAEAARDAAVKSSVELKANAAAAAAGAAQASQALSTLQDNLNVVKIQHELSERTRTLFEEKCSEMSEHIAVLEKELQQLRPLQPSYLALQRQYVELQEQIHAATEDARREVNRIENDLRRVERCANAGSELRERARLAAAAHARDRRLAAAELRDTARELHNATAEIARLKLTNVELKNYLSVIQEKINKGTTETTFDESELKETKAALEAERNTSARLERALHAALSDNATLAKEIHRADHISEEISTEVPSNDEATATNICPIDLFLADN